MIKFHGISMPEGAALSWPLSDIVIRRRTALPSDVVSVVARYSTNGRFRRYLAVGASATAKPLALALAVAAITAVPASAGSSFG